MNVLLADEKELVGKKRKRLKTQGESRVHRHVRIDILKLKQLKFKSEIFQKKLLN